MNRSSAHTFAWATLALFGAVTIAGNASHVVTVAPEQFALGVPVAVVTNSLPGVALLMVTHLASLTLRGAHRRSGKLLGWALVVLAGCAMYMSWGALYETAIAVGGMSPDRAIVFPAIVDLVTIVAMVIVVFGPDSEPHDEPAPTPAEVAPASVPASKPAPVVETADPKPERRRARPEPSGERAELIARARELREQKKLSYGDIAVELDVPRATVGRWLKEPKADELHEQPALVDA